MDEDNYWTLAHYSVLVQQYAGEYLGVWKKQVVAHGTDPETVLQAAAASGRPPQEVVLVAFPDPFADLPR